jgi:hypothetical protein
MKVTVCRYREFSPGGRVAVSVAFINEAGEIIREERVIVPAGLTLERLWYEALKAAKRKCAETCFTDAEEQPPTCDHGELDWHECLICLLQDERD